MVAADELNPDQILQVLEAVHRDVPAEPHIGLRERKKQQLRQRISNTATALFLAHGFDRVTVAQIAAACEVSEQTVFNYFPTKEAMFFDRSERSAGDLADAIRHRRDVPLTDAILSALVERGPLDGLGHVDETLALSLFRRFGATVEQSPSLAAARDADLIQLVGVVADALAERVGAHPDDPEVQISAIAVLGLAATRSRSTFLHLQGATSIAALDASVVDDVTRAVRTLAPALDAFDRQPAGVTAGDPGRQAGQLSADR